VTNLSNGVGGRKRLLVVFGKRTADEILATAQSAYADFFSHFIVLYFDQQLENGGRLNSVPIGFDEIYYCIGVVDFGIRSEIEKAATEYGMVPFTIIHPTAVVDPSAKIGVGCFIGPLSAVSLAASISNHTIVHMHSSIGHDSRVGPHCVILPGARISGDVTLGEGVLIGSNAFVFQGSSVGEHTHVDALTYVRGNIDSGQIVSVRWPHAMKRVGWKVGQASTRETRTE
jgi:UDP-3-O-[3-hydroxymyristoyl] glucosamine N-acyltransferase